MNDSILQDSYNSKWGVTILKFSGFSGTSRQPYAVRLKEAGPDLNRNYGPLPFIFPLPVTLCCNYQQKQFSTVETEVRDALC